MPTLGYDAVEGTVLWPTVPASGPDEVLTLLVLRLRAPLGSYPADVTIGLPYDRWFGRRPRSEEVVAAVRAQVERDERLSVRRLEASVGASGIAVVLEVDVTDDGTTMTAQVQGSLFTVDAVSAWTLTGRRAA